MSMVNISKVPHYVLLLTLGIPSLRVFENPEPKRDFKTFLATRGQSLKESRVRGFLIEGIDQFLPASFPSLSLVLESSPFPCSPCSPYLRALMIGSPVHRRTCKLHTGNAHIPLLCSHHIPQQCWKEWRLWTVLTIEKAVPSFCRKIPYRSIYLRVQLTGFLSYL